MDYNILQHWSLKRSYRHKHFPCKILGKMTALFKLNFVSDFYGYSYLGIVPVVYIHQSCRWYFSHRKTHFSVFLKGLKILMRSSVFLDAKLSFLILHVFVLYYLNCIYFHISRFEFVFISKFFKFIIPGRKKSPLDRFQQNDRYKDRKRNR